MLHKLKQTPGRHPLPESTRYKLCAVAAAVALVTATLGMVELLAWVKHPLAGDWPWRFVFSASTNTNPLWLAHVKDLYALELFLLNTCVLVSALAAAWLVWINTDPRDIKPALVSGQKRDIQGLADALKKID